MEFVVPDGSFPVQISTVDSIDVIATGASGSVEVVFPTPETSTVIVLPTPGPKGDKGDTGDTGDTGPQGDPGTDATVNATNMASVISGAAEKTTPVDADKLPVIDSAASGALKWLSWSNLWAGIKSKLDGVLTIAGAKTLSGQLQLTGQSATDANSAMTRSLVLYDRYARIGLTFAEPIPLVGGTGGGRASVSGSQATLSLTGAGPSSYRYAMYGRLNVFGDLSGQTINYSKKFIAGAKFWISDLEAGNTTVRFYIAMPYSPTPFKFSNEPFATGNAVAVEFSRSGSGSGTQIIAKILYFNGTAQESGPYVLVSGTSYPFSCLSWVLTNDGAGVYRLWCGSYQMASGSAARLDLSGAPNLSITGGPTGNPPIYGFIPTVLLATSTTGPATAASSVVVVQSFSIDLIE